MNAFVNEFHYDDSGADEGEFFEIAGVAGTDLSGWSLVLYNGATDDPYETVALSGVFSDDVDGFGFLTFDVQGIQNGGPDGFALIDDTDAVVEFLSYEGSFTAETGPAAGLTSTDIEVFEPNTTPEGQSLQRVGFGVEGSDFTFTGPVEATPGAVNVGQSFGDVTPPPVSAPSLVISEIMYNPDSAEDDWEWVEVVNTGDAAIDLAGWVFDDANSSFHGEANIAAGAVAAGESAVLYNADDLSAEDFAASWGEGLNLVGVTNWSASALNNSGDVIGIWDSFEAYQSDIGDGIVFDNTIVTVDYDDSGDWPADNNDASIYLTDLAADANDGTNWALSTVGTETPAGVGRDSVANGATGNDGDVGSPGGDPEGGGGGGGGGDEPLATVISAIQGSSAGVTKVRTDDQAALEGVLVSIQAVVTADFQTGGLGGFYVQEEDADQDADASTSEGIFIFDGALIGSPDVNVGDVVTVVGIVEEFFGQTQIAADSITVDATGAALPTATVVDLGSTGVILDDDSGVDYVVNLEAFEGMLVTFEEALTISEMFNLDRFGEYRLSSEGRPNQFTQDNAPDVAGYDAHLQDVAARAIVLDDGLTAQNPFEIQVIDGNDGVLGPEDSVRMGDEITNVTGVVAYGFDEYRIHDATGDYAPTNPRPESPEDVEGDFKVASLNVLNYFTTLDTTPGGFNGPNTSGPDDTIEPRGANSPEELERQATKLVAAIIEMDADVLGLVELENDDDEAIADIVARVNAALDGDVYDFIPTGDVGTDAITTGIIYKTETAIPTGDVAVLTEFNGESFTDPLQTGQDRNRPAVTQTFEDVSSGALVTVAVNHFKSKGSATGAPEDEDMNDGAARGDATRTEGARILAEWLATDPTGTGAENQLIIGDLNAYAAENPLQVLADAGFTDLAAAFIEDPYSFVFDGQLGTLDYILANGPAFEAAEGATEWHINADEADAIDYNIEITTVNGSVVTRDPAIFNGETAARNSDHDPVIAGFTFEAEGGPVEIVGTENRDILTGTDADEVFIGLGNTDVFTGGGGADIFIPTQGVTIRDFGDGDDRIDLSELGVQGIEELKLIPGAIRTSVVDEVTGVRFGVVGDDGGPAALTAESFIFAPTESMVLTGGEGRQALIGRAGDDVFDGGADEDFYTGNGGEDLFIAGLGGVDTVVDFTVGEDLIDVTAFGATGFEDLTIIDRPGVGIVEIKGEVGLMRLRTQETGVSGEDLTAESFVFANDLLT